MRRLATIWLLALGLPAAAAPLQLEFPAGAGRLPTGLYVHRGDQIHIVALGEWTMWEGHFAPVNAAGHRYRAGNVSWGRLTARIGLGPEIAVGTERSWSASAPGELVLYPYVGDLGLKSPAGKLSLTIEGGTPVEQVIDELAKDGVKLTIPASGGPTITDLWVDPGETVEVDAFGEWTMWPQGTPVSATGDFDHRLEAGVPWGRLMARFGGPDFSTDPDYEVGVSRQLRPERGGLLEFRPAVGEYGAYQRSGQLTVVVRGARVADDRTRARAAREAEDYERAIGFLRVYQARKALALPDAFTAPALMRAAQAHAEYLAAHGGGHEEEAGQTGFTGTTAAERATAAGFHGEVAGELIHGDLAGLDAVDGLWSTIYHRVPFLDPAVTAYGTGVAKGPARIAFVVLAAVPTTQSAEPPARLPAVTTYPLRDQVRVPASWSGLESPSPFEPTTPRPVGYPISVTLTGADIAEVVDASLETIRGVPVPILVVAPGADPAGLLRATAFLIAREAMDPETGYKVSITLKTTAGDEISESWGFTTGLGQRPFLTVPRLGHPANPPIDLGRLGPMRPAQ